MERVLLHKAPGLPRLERVTDRSAVFCLCVEDPPPSSKRAIKNPVGIVRGGCELCGGSGLVSDELAARFIGGLLELQEAGNA